jgi:VCBS repeat protein
VPRSPSPAVAAARSRPIPVRSERSGRREAPAAKSKGAWLALGLVRPIGAVRPERSCRREAPAAKSKGAWLALGLLACAACGDTAAVITVDGDLAVPADVDALCLAVDDADPAGGAFAQVYPLQGDLASLPQSLTVEPGSAASAVARVRGTLGGLEVARDQESFGFGGITDVSLQLLACPTRSAGDAAAAGSFAAPAGARAAASWGRGGTLVIAVAAGSATALRADGAGLTELPAVLPPAPAATPAALLAVDVDGDCDDDLVQVGAAGLALWRRDGAAFADASDALAGAGPAVPVAAAAADVDGDGDLDLAVGGNAELFLLRNDGSGRFGRDAAAIPGGAVTDVTALAFGDVDGDGHVDLAVGQGSATAAPPLLLINDAAGTGSFVVGAAALPDLPLRVRGLAFLDADGDGARDLVIAALGTNVRLFVNRGQGFLEDRSFITLPATTPVDAVSVAAAEWGGDCFPDLAVGLAGGAGLPLSWRGGDGGVFTDDPLAAATAGDQVLLADVDDDGFRDLLIAGGAAGITWLRRP